MSKRLLLVFLGLSIFSSPFSGIAQELEEPVAPLTAIITGPDDVAVGRTIVLDAALSRVEEGVVAYRWFINDQEQPISETVEAVYTPELPGAHTFRVVMTVTRPPTEEGGEATVLTAEATHIVTVYDRKMVLIAEATVPADKIEAHRQIAMESNVFLRVLQPVVAATPLGAEEQLITLISEQSASLAGANTIILWGDGVTGLQALMRALRGDEELLAGIHNQSIVLITDQSLNTLSRLAKGPFGELQPSQIVITRKEALNQLFTATSMDQFLTSLDQRDVEHLTIDETTVGLRPWNLLSALVNAMLTRGVPSQTVILLLVLPVIAMILAFLKQVIGIITFGLYTPSIIALSFLALGWQLGVLFLLFIVTTGYATRALMKRWRLLYIPKVAIILSVVSITLLILMGISAFFEITFSRETIFILLIMSTLAESFLNVKTEQGWKPAIVAIGETTLASLLCVFVVQWTVFQSLILAYPELILLTFVADVILGRWTGLRLVEYFRFREVFKHMQEE